MNKTIKQNKLNTKQQDDAVVKDIVNIINKANAYALFDLNTILIKRNWLIGKIYMILHQIINNMVNKRLSN